MRQNIKDIHHKLIEGDNGLILKYGLMINIDLDNFNLNNIDLTKDYAKIEFESNDVRVETITSRPKEFLEVSGNNFDNFHKQQVKHGLIITIPKNKIIKEPLEIQTTLISNNSFQHIKIIAEEGSEAVFVDILRDNNNNEGYNSKFVEVITKKNAKIDYYHIQEINNKKIHYSKKTGKTSENSELNWYDFTLGSKVTISNLTTNLEGVNSRSEVQSIVFSDGTQQFDILGQAIHKTKETFGNVSAKGAMKGKSKCLYRGNIHIEKEAPNSEGYQRADLMILDNGAEADAIPQLLIDNNDVKCSHAVAIGRIDEEKLFYLMSRGITKEEAKNQIVKGFFESTIRNIKLESVANNLREVIERKMLK